MSWRRHVGEQMSHIGHRVLLHIDRNTPAGQVEGVLLSIDEEGEAEMDVGGTRRWCWPALHVECRDCEADEGRMAS